MRVAKFGGSSVANAAQLQKVANIITSDPSRKFVVVSAPGKRFDDDTKVTDLLINLGKQSDQNKPYQDQLKHILLRFEEMLDELGLSHEILKEIEDSLVSIVEGETVYTHKMDALKATGEDTSAKILSQYLTSIGYPASYVHPQEAGIMVSDEPGKAQVLEESYDKLYQLREREGIQVIPGFFGYTLDGQLMAFPRGGSDITGSIVAAGVKAELYENFTDVDSVYCVNPNIVESPKEIYELTYKEMRELSYAGFSVFHDEALIPAIKAKIPVAIKNTNHPDGQGTIISAERTVKDGPVVGIASDTGFLTIYVSKYLMNREKGFARHLFQILEEEDISFEHAPSGIDDMSVIMRDGQLTPEKEEVVLRRIKEELQVDTVTTERDLALIMIVGEGMNRILGVTGKATQAISNATVNIEMVNQGSSEVSMMFGIKKDGMIPAVQSLYREFFEV